MGDRDTRIRDEAYRIWVDSGRPDGAEHEHWLEAERRIGAAERDETVVAGPKSVKKAAKAELAGPPGEGLPKPRAKAAAGVAAAPSGAAKARPASAGKGEAVEIVVAAKPGKSRKPA